MEVKINLPDIKGYIYTGKWEIPKKGELFIYENGILDMARRKMHIRYHILRKLDDPIKLPERVGLPIEWDDNDIKDEFIKIIDYLKHLKDEINTLKETK